MEMFGYRYLLGEPWLPYSIFIALVSVALSIFFVRRMPMRPWLSFLLTCLTAFFTAFLASGIANGFSGGGEALFWNLFGGAFFAPIWLPVCAVVHIVLRRDLIRRR
ncbi:hypothetical protein PEL8287_01770 [Roseovarius litorisediminis]|uniref:Uncharacterized protein n=1 Tax=Roseovarius litorisediminis TaxID=1312363 RepID=A0A1Y5SBL9_9RHOB|nr:hypothetical protein PEL8287_01770 [Roseovarius litorisediminis]